MIAIDPGASGGMVSAGLALIATSMPKTERDIVDFIKSDSNGIHATAYLEDLVKYAGRNMPSSSMAVYASNWGIVKGCLLTLNYRIVLVPPKKWQAALGLGTAKGLTKTQWKNKLKQKAQELFPQLPVTLSTADALLIYEAARRNLLG